jgi:RimJ/RimL family protein N-acetyltransferase
MELHTKRLRLRELAEEDAIHANAYESDPDVVRYSSHGVRTLDESRTYIALDPERARIAPYDLRSAGCAGRQRLIGRCGFHLAKPDQKEAEIWYILDKRHWGNGYVPEAMTALITFAFDTLGVRRIVADLDPRNVASARVCQKLGMRREAHFVENVFIKGEWCDTVIYAMLDREWPFRVTPVDDSI